LLIDDLERQISKANRRLKDGHADHPYIPRRRARVVAGNELAAAPVRVREPELVWPARSEVVHSGRLGLDL
jgi:hypothetical protein